MNHYRKLTLEELNSLEKEFIEYLILNGITASDWEKLKVDEPIAAQGIVDAFSEVVFEGIMLKVTYIEYRENRLIHAFQCLSDKLVLVAMEAPVESKVNFNDASFAELALKNPPANIKVYTAEKPYNKKREHEIFEMIQAGCVISDGKIFKALCLAL